MAGEGHAHGVLEKGHAHLLLEGLVEVFGDAIRLKVLRYQAQLV